MIDISSNQAEQLISKFISQTKENKINWTTVSLDSFMLDEYISNYKGWFMEDDSFYFEFNDGLFYVIHRVSHAELPSTDFMEEHKISREQLKDVVTIGEAYVICVQGNSQMPLEEIPFCDLNESLIFTLVQLIVRTRGSAKDLVLEFLGD